MKTDSEMPIPYKNTDRRREICFFTIPGNDDSLIPPEDIDNNLYGVGRLYPRRDELPEWAQSALALFDVADNADGRIVYLPGVGYRGAFWNVILGPKHEDC